MQRRALSAEPSVAVAAATATAERFLANVHLGRGSRLGLYRAHDGELDPRPLERAAGVDGVVVFLPTIAGSTLEFASIGPDTSWLTNEFGIDEPAHGDRVLPGELDVVVVPLVAFDDRCHRLGHGHGYYDRAFAFRLGRPAPPMLIGYGFDEQQIERVVNHSGDVPLDCIITPTKVVRPVDR